MSTPDGEWLGDDDGFDQEEPRARLPTISKGPVPPSLSAPAGVEPVQDEDDEGESLWQTEDDPVSIPLTLQAGDEAEELPDPNALFLQMQAQLEGVSLASEPDPGQDDLPDPSALFLQMQKLGESAADSGEFPDAQALFQEMRARAESEVPDPDDLPDPHALFLQMQKLGDPQTDPQGSHDSAEELDDLPDPNELYLQLRALEAASEDVEDLPDPDALFLQMQSNSRAPDDDELPDPNELFLKFRTLEIGSQAAEEEPELPDGDELFQSMQRGNPLQFSVDDDDLPDPNALFLQMRNQETEIEEPLESDVLPDPSALFLQMQAHHLSEEMAPDPFGSHDSGSGKPFSGLLDDDEEEWFTPMTEPTSPHSDLGLEVEKLGLFGRLKAKFSRKVEISDPSPSRQYDENEVRETLPDPSELFRRMQTEEADDFDSEDVRPTPTLPDPGELFRRMQAEDLENSESGLANLESPEELPALPDLDAFRAELEAEEMSRLDADLLGDLSGPERFADTVSDLAFNAGTFFDKAPTSGAIQKSPAHRQSKRPVEEVFDDSPLPAMLGGPDISAQRPTLDPVDRDTIRVPDSAGMESDPLGSPEYVPAAARKPAKSKRSTTEVARDRAAAPAPTVGLVQRMRTASRRPKQLSRHGLSIFTRQLAAMLKSGIALHQCISFCAEADPAAEPILRDVVKKIESGYTLSGALHEYPDSFDPVFIGLVHSGELSGRLNDMLARLADILEREIELRKRMISVITYPAVLLAVSMLGTLGFIFFVLPQLTPLFTDLKVDLPWPTQVLLSLRSVLLPLSILGALSAAALWFSKSRVSAFIKERPSLERRLAAFPLSIPVIGGVYEKLITARVLYSMATMLEVGVTMSQALARAEGTSGNAYVGFRLSRARADLADGASVTECFQVNQVFPETAMQLIAAGEESARIVEMFSYVARHFDEEVEHSMDAAASLLEPIIMVVMGCIVGFIVIASALPTIQLLQNFG